MKAPRRKEECVEAAKMSKSDFRRGPLQCRESGATLISINSDGWAGGSVGDE